MFFMPNATAFEGKSVCLFKDFADAEAPPFVAGLKKYVADLGNTMMEKQDSMSKVMVKKGFKTAMSKFETNLTEDTWKDITGASDFMHDSGATPWICAIKSMTYKYGANEFPLNGYGCGIMALNTELIVTAFQADGLVWWAGLHD